MPQNKTTRQLIFSYVSTMCILCLLIIAAQVFIQLALRSATQTENAYSVLNAQEIRTQRLIRNAILTVGAPTDRSAALLGLYVDTAQWELTQAAIDSGNAPLHIDAGDFPPSVHQRLNAARNDYRAMQTALHGLILLETNTKPDQKALMDYLSVIFYRGGVYLNALLAGATELLADADAYTGKVSLMEYALCALSLLVIAIEALFVWRPAMAQMHLYLEAMHQMVDEQHARRIAEEELRTLAPERIRELGKEED